VRPVVEKSANEALDPVVIFLKAVDSFRLDSPAEWRLKKLTTCLLSSGNSSKWAGVVTASVLRFW
jgi:hypothetical protein